MQKGGFSHRQKLYSNYYVISLGVGTKGAGKKLLSKTKMKSLTLPSSSRPLHGDSGCFVILCKCFFFYPEYFLFVFPKIAGRSWAGGRSILIESNFRQQYKEKSETKKPKIKFISEEKINHKSFWYELEPCYKVHHCPWSIIIVSYTIEKIFSS